MSNTRITQCQALLLDQPCIWFHKTLAINPASLLPDDDPEDPIHDCTEVTDAVQTARPDLTDAPLSSPDEVLFMDGSNYVQDGIRYVGAAVVTLDRTIWAQPFDGDTVPSPRKEGYQLQPERTLKDISLIRGPLAPKGSLTLRDSDLRRTPSYIKQEEELAEQKQAIKGPDGWWTLPDDRLLVPEALGRTLVAQLHQATHIGEDKVITSIVTRSTVCAQGNSPGEHWEVDFTEIKPPASEYKYLLVLTDTFSGWVEAYPTRTETTSIVVKKLLQEIILRFGLPIVIGSDNSPAFVAKARCTPYREGFPPFRDHVYPYRLCSIPREPPISLFEMLCQCLPRTLYIPSSPGLGGRYTVILSTPTAVEVDGIQTWLHHSQLLHQETAWILATSALTREIPSLGYPHGPGGDSTPAGEELDFSVDRMKVRTLGYRKRKTPEGAIEQQKKCAACECGDVH
ncbi:hypothetical protein QTO34_019731 [Cnephaeus nilssonii]|uniref:Integrase catalytic domain-containing protein n=1 Tax=Cnephaeus nilssonii TaxID=3371016 RepID=A0AA40LP94_CNENI|nr:hypothetical protein QTO34_019731 [Eptesicus nilssonii]